MAQPKIILLNDIDIYARGDVKNIINLVEEKTFSRDKLINDEFLVEVKNFDNFYSVENNISYFKNIRWRYGSLKIYNLNNDLVWDGIIRNIERNNENGTAAIKTISKLHRKYLEVIEYESSADETPAETARNIMDTYDITYDSGTIQTSINKLENESCYIRMKVTKEDDMTVMGAIEKLAEYACADAYSHLGKVYFKHWSVFTGGVKVSLTENDFKVRPFISDTEEELINNFSIPYYQDGGIPITDATGNNIGAISRQDIYYGVHDLPGFDNGGSESEIWFIDQTSAQYIGECYINRTHINLSTNPRPPYIIEFELKGTHEDWIDLETYVNITLSEESWVNKTFEFFKTEINYNNNSTKLRAIEVQT